MVYLPTLLSLLSFVLIISILVFGWSDRFSDTRYRAKLAWGVFRKRPLMYKVQCSPITIKNCDDIVIASCTIDGTISPPNDVVLHII